MNPQKILIILFALTILFFPASASLQEEGTPDAVTSAGLSTGLNAEAGETEIIDESDVEAPTVISAEAMDKNTVIVLFSEEVILPPENPEAEFSISQEFDKTASLEVVKASLVENDKTRAKLVTGNQEKGLGYVLTVSANITDLAGNPIVSGITDTATFVGSDLLSATPEEEVPAEEEESKTPAEEEKDLVAPEDITNLLISFERVLDKYLVKLNWIPSINSAGDLIDQILYTSLDRGNTYDGGKSLGPNVDNYALKDMEGGREYTFKITAKDIHGNESAGVVKSIRLPQTGPLAIFGLGISFLSAGIISWRRNRRK